MEVKNGETRFSVKVIYRINFRAGTLAPSFLTLISVLALLH